MVSLSFLQMQSIATVPPIMVHSLLPFMSYYYELKTNPHELKNINTLLTDEKKSDLIITTIHFYWLNNYYKIARKIYFIS